MNTKNQTCLAALILCFCMLLSAIMIPTPANATDIKTSDPSALSPQETVFRFITGQMGMNAAVACGIMANIDAESSFNPKLSGGGICQWRGSRWAALVNFCETHGYDNQSLEGQLYFLKFELEDDYPELINRFRALENTADGAYTAGYYFCYDFERPGNTAAVSSERGNCAKEEYWSAYGNKNTDYSSPAQSNPDSSGNNSSSSVTGTLPNGTYRILNNGASQMSLNAAASGSPKNRDNINISSYNSAKASQHWTLENSTSGYKIHSGTYGFVLNIMRDGTPRDGDNVDIRTSVGGDNCQLWKLDCIDPARNIYIIRSVGDERCVLTATGGTANSNVNVRQYNGSTAQQWIIESLSQQSSESSLSLADDPKTIVMRLNAVKALLEGVEIAVDPTNSDVAPFTLNGKTMVPVRFVQQLGADVKYESSDQPVTVSYGGIVLTLEFGKYVMMKSIDGQPPETIKLPTPPSLVEGKTCVPIREVAEGLDFRVSYDPSTFVIVVSTASIPDEERSSKAQEGKERLPAFVEGVLGITSKKTSFTVKAGENIQLIKSDITFDPASVGCNKLIYSSDNDSIATVNSTGRVTAKSKGTAKITIASHNGKTTVITVTVN